MYKRIFVLMLMSIWFCGCKSGDPHVRRSEMLKESEQIAKAQTEIAMTTVDATVDTAIEELRSAIEQNKQSTSSLESKLEAFKTQNAESVAELKSSVETSTGRHSNSIERNAKSISSVQSRLETLTAQNAELVSEFKSTLEQSTRRNSNSVRQNTESISNLESTLNGFAEQNAQSIESFRADLDRLEEELSQVRLDVRRELSKQQAEQTRTTGQLAREVALLHGGLPGASLSPAEYQRDDASRMRYSPSEGAPLDGKGTSRARYNAAFLPEDGELAFLQDGPYQLLVVLLGLAVILSGPVVAELYARKQRKLALYPAKKLAEMI
jgi:hypothetical protein